MTLSLRRVAAGMVELSVGQLPAQLGGQLVQIDIGKAGDQGKVKRDARIAGKVVHHRQQQSQVVLEFRSAATGQQPDSVCRVGQRLGG